MEPPEATGSAEGAGSAASEEKWICPVAGCGHAMRRNSAGRRAHFLRRHPQLCRPCPKDYCAHGCTVCVSQETLELGKATPGAGKVLKRPAHAIAASSSSDACKKYKTPSIHAHLRQVAPLETPLAKRSQAEALAAQPDGSGEKSKRLKSLQGQPVGADAAESSDAAVQKRLSGRPRKIVDEALPKRGPGRPRKTAEAETSQPAATAQAAHQDDAEPQPSWPGEGEVLAPEELTRLLRDGVNAEAVLRGVNHASQREVLRLLKHSEPCATAPAGEAYEVPIGLGARATQLKLEQESRRQEDEEWLRIAASHGASWPEANAGAAPSLERVGPDGGVGPDGSFALCVVAGPSGAGVSRLLRQLAESLDLPTGGVQRFRSDQAVASCFEDAVSMLPRVGLNSIPAWMRPYHVLSNGQQQRVRLALGLKDGAVVDDFGSGIDEQEIHSIAHGLGKFIRQAGLSRVLIGTHSMDAVKFLQPDFVVFTSGQWSVNPNPSERRSARACLAPAFLGKLQWEADGVGPEETPYEHTSRKSHRAMRVPKRTLQVKVSIDDRLTDAANAFEVNFDGTARCSIPTLPREEVPAAWQIGLVVGPSGTGKTMTLRHFQRRDGEKELGGDLSAESPVLDDGAVVFSHVATAAGCPHRAAESLTACRVPKHCWLQAPPSLSRSEAWRVQLAWQLAGAVQESCKASLDRRSEEVQAPEAGETPAVTIEDDPSTVIVDEFTTQLDRQHARDLCASLAKYVRSTNVRLLCATVHRDVTSWLSPCWMLDTEHGEFSSREPGAEDEMPEEEPTASQIGTYSGPEDETLWEPPTLTFDVRVIADESVKPVWHERFMQHHYLSHDLRSANRGGSLIAVERASGQPAAFHASHMLPGAKVFVREYRLVVLPEWQGFGIGPRLSNFAAARWMEFYKEKGYGFSSMTAHPRLGELRQRDPCWSPNSSNLMPPKKDGKAFGNIGSFGGEKGGTIIIKFVHGSRMKISSASGSSKAHLATCPRPDVVVDLCMPVGAVDDIEAFCGLNFKVAPIYNLLWIASLTGRAAQALGEVQVESGWCLVSVNDTSVKSREALREALRSAGKVATLTFQVHPWSDSQRMGPKRETSEEAANDATWIQQRCVAQLDLHSEEKQVVELISMLKKTEKRFRKTEVVVRPDTPAFPLDVLPTLLETNLQAQKSRITYSHTFVGNPDSQLNVHGKQSDQKIHLNYQAWMFTRVQELRAAGKTHQGAILAAAEEYGIGVNIGGQIAGMRVYKFPWSGFSDDVPQSSGKELTAFFMQAFGLHLGETAVVTGASPEGESKLPGFPRQWGRAECRILALRRGMQKIEIASLSELAEAVVRLRSMSDENALIYVRFGGEPNSTCARTKEKVQAQADATGVVEEALEAERREQLEDEEAEALAEDAGVEDAEVEEAEAEKVTDPGMAEAKDAPIELLEGCANLRWNSQKQNWRAVAWEGKGGIKVFNPNNYNFNKEAAFEAAFEWREKKMKERLTAKQEAGEMLEVKRYTGTFSHPQIGTSECQISVTLRSDDSGFWSALDRIESVRVTKQGADVEIADEVGAKSFKGSIDTHDVIRGEVFFRKRRLEAALGGGSFLLRPNLEEAAHEPTTPPLSTLPPTLASPQEVASNDSEGASPWANDSESEANEGEPGHAGEEQEEKQDAELLDDEETRSAISAMEADAVADEAATPDSVEDEAGSADLQDDAVRNDANPESA